MLQNKQLHIVGGTYLERCTEPSYEELYGSGMRAACALSDKEFHIKYISCIGRGDFSTAQSTCSIFNIESFFTCIDETVLFEYYHPLAEVFAYSKVLDTPTIVLPSLEAEFVLFYGMIEATISINAKYVVYDPQNHISFRNTNSKAEHLALVLNRKEAILLANASGQEELSSVGKILLEQEGAEVVIIKDGSNGGFTITSTGIDRFSVYQTSAVWPIGSGDIFSAAFAWKWMLEGIHPNEAAVFASQCTAEFCETQTLPLPKLPNYRNLISERDKPRKIYLAAPFFTSADRWLVHELRKLLISFGNDVFSPYHDVGIINDITSLEAQKEIAYLDLKALENAEVILVVANGLDTGTIFELGYAVAKGKRVIVLIENINLNDLTMIAGSGCEIVSDISTAIYKASW
jgi:hypothetical protein